MAPSACRLSMLTWSLALLLSLLVTTAGSTTVTKTHISTTKITVNDNEHSAHHAIAPTLEDSNPTAEESKHDSSLGEESPSDLARDLDLNKRNAQSDTLTSSAKPGVLFSVGTHIDTFTAGSTKVVDGTLFSLDTGSQSLYWLLPISKTASTGAGGSSNAWSSTTLAGTVNATLATVLGNGTGSVTLTENVGQTAVSTSGASGSVVSSSTGASLSGPQSESSATSNTSSVTSAGASGSTSVNPTTSTTSGEVPSASNSQGTSLTSSSLVGQSAGANQTATFANTSASISHSGTSTHALSSSSAKLSTTSNTSATSSSTAIVEESPHSIGISNQTVASSTSSSTTSTAGVTGTQSTGMNTTAVSLSVSSSDPKITTFTSAHNTSSSISSTASTSSTALFNSTTTSINSASSRSSSTTSVTTLAGKGNVTTSTPFKSSTRANSTSTTTVPGASRNQSRTEVVTTFVSTITAINISDASGSQTSTKIVTTFVSTMTGFSNSLSLTSTTEDENGSSSSSTTSVTSASSSDEETTPSSTDDDASTLVTPPPLSSTASNETLQEVTLMTGQWDEEVMQMSCEAPCTITLPPIPLNTPATLRYPPAITSVCTNVGGQIYRYATTVSVDPIVITELALLPVSVGAMTGRHPAVTSEVDFSLPHGSCSMALPSGDICAKRPVDSTNGTCGPQGGLGCPDMQCCGPSGTCGDSSSECAIDNGCNHDFGPCWLPGEESFRPLSEVFASATDTSACPIALLPGPSDGPEIAQPDITDPTTPLPLRTSTDGQGSLITLTTHTTSSGQVIPIPIPIPLPTPPPGGPPGPGPPKLPVPPKPRLCLVFCGGVKLPGWKLDLSCRGPLCKNIGPRRGCLGGLCDLLKCVVGCEKKGGGNITPADKPKPDPEDPPGPDDEDEPEEPETETESASASASASRTQSISESESECETTMTATQVTAMCNIFTEVVGINMGNDTTLSAPQTTCTSTKRRITQGCEVTGTTTTMYDSCTKKQTATEITKFCTESVSAGVTYTPCTKTASTLFEGCSVTATTTSVIDDVCQAQVTLAPDDPQGEFGMLPANSSNATCPYFPGVNVTVLDDQGADGQSNETCPMPNGTRTSFDDDQGDDEPKSSCKLGNGTTIDSSSAPSCPLSNATLIQGPDGAEDGNVTASCPLNGTIVYEPDGALDSDSAPSCNATFGFNMTMEQELGQGETGLKANQSCPFGGNSMLEVDNEQGEDRQPTEEDSCPVIPDGIVLSPLADLGDYAPSNESSCPALDGRFPISWLDEQGDDWEPLPSTTDCGYPLVDNLGKCTLVDPRTTRLGLLAPGLSTLVSMLAAEQASSMRAAGSSITSNTPVIPWSCTCDFQTQGQVVNATTKCGTPMCPNWQTTTTRTTTKINTNPLFTFKDPSLPPLSSPTPGHIEPARCSCTITTVSGDRTCIRPTSCPNSDCVWPVNTKLGRCSYVPVSTRKWIGPPRKTPLAPVPTSKYWTMNQDPDIDYCMCEGQGSAMIDAMDGCNTERICPNQVAFVTHTWPAVTPAECASTPGLPSLPWFESCDLTTDTFTETIEDATRSSIVTFCLCNKVSETAKSYVVSTVSRQCNGMYMCQNSDGFVPGKSQAHKRMHERAPTPTAAGPVLAVTTDATPGSVPTTAAEPTILMAE